jgi:type II secretory pathway pseudopilin PulG
MRIVKDITFMYLEGQGCAGPKRLSSRPHTRFDDDGFTMVVLLVVIAIMAVGMSAMLPTWRQQAIREKEEELIFRGNQYARALVLYTRKNNNLLPANIDLLYEGRYLRKKWKDPITNADFGLLAAGQPANAQGAPQGPGAPAGGRGGAPAPQPPARGGTGQIFGSIQGVYSTSSDTSIRVYQNQQRYIDWQFTVQTALPLMGGMRGGGPGGPGGGPGGRGPGAGGSGGPGGRGPGAGGPGAGGPGRGGPGLGAPPRGGGPAGGPPRGGVPTPPGGRGRGGN